SQACCRSTNGGASVAPSRPATSRGIWGMLVKRALAGGRTQTSPVPGACSTVELQGLGLAGTTRQRAASAFGERRSVQLSYGEMGMPPGRQVKLPSLPYGRQVKLPSVDARGRTWNTRLRRPVLCPLSYVDKNSAEAGRFERPKPTGPTR